MPLTTPIVFIIFNRPDTTSRVFAEIARAQPRQLLVIADGPRSADEVIKCEEAREIIQQVNWDCEVLTNFSDVNLGCKRRVSSGLDWVFELCEEAIILEDDCLPHPTFFPYCEELLTKYRADDRIMTINGNNFQVGQEKRECSYYFSAFAHIWGWASWRRSWQHYDVTMSDWPEHRSRHWLETVLGMEEAANKWCRDYEETYSGQLDTWDCQWGYTILKRGGLCIAPNDNLITNIGFGNGATHTKDANSTDANLSAPGIALPLRHPLSILRDDETDVRGLRRLIETHFISVPLTLPQRVKRKAKFLGGKMRDIYSEKLDQLSLGRLKSRRNIRLK